MTTGDISGSLPLGAGAIDNVYKIAGKTVYLELFTANLTPPTF